MTCSVGRIECPRNFLIFSYIYFTRLNHFVLGPVYSDEDSFVINSCLQAKSKEIDTEHAKVFTLQSNHNILLKNGARADQPVSLSI